MVMEGMGLRGQGVMISLYDMNVSTRCFVVDRSIQVEVEDVGHHETWRFAVDMEAGVCGGLRLYSYNSVRGYCDGNSHTQCHHWLFRKGQWDTTECVPFGLPPIPPEVDAQARLAFLTHFLATPTTVWMG